MATSFFLLLFSLLSLNYTVLSIPNIYKAKSFLNSSLLAEPSKSLNDTPPTVFFEVTKPIKVPHKVQPCVYNVLQHDFASTYGKPPVFANYTPPSHCQSQHFSKVVLEWNSTCKGRQFDRIFGVWLGGVELVRSCTAEPRPNGIFWSLQKDITRYYPLLTKNEIQEFAVYIGNIVDTTYTGVYHVNITIYFYPAKDKFSYDSDKADLILPISRNLPLNDGLWFKIENFTDTQLKEFVIPQNVYRAVLEVYVSFHENDEFWYSNYPNEYIVANNLTDTPGNGPFREVVVSLDGKIVGAIYPFTVIYTGGINPLLWRPITAIGSYNLPSYDIEITPFLGSILDGNTHEFGFSVTNALNVWYVDANLHLWLDPKSTRTKGMVLEHETEPLDLSLALNVKNLNGKFLTSAKRSIIRRGWVESSKGKITTTFNQELSYRNLMKIGEDNALQIVKQIIKASETVSFKKHSSSSYVDFHSSKSSKSFRIEMYSEISDEGNDGNSLFVTNLTLGFNEDKLKTEKGFGIGRSSLRNVQDAEGVMVVKNNMVVSGVGSTKQTYKYEDPKLCYLRKVGSSNYTLLFDTVSSNCNRN